MLQGAKSTLAREDESNKAEVGQSAGELPPPLSILPPPQDVLYSSHNDPDIYNTLPSSLFL